MTASGEQALTLLKSGVVKYSAIATDVNLDGETTGWEVAKQARENDPHGASADQWPSQGIPGSILLQKPFAPAQLLTAVSQLLNASPPAT
jgi:CheY-like chemotaxis protein